MTEQSFEEQVSISIKNKIIKEIQNSELLSMSYGERKPVPKQIIEDIWQSVNWVEVIEEIRPKIQLRICNAIIGSMETEIKSDVKKILSIDGVRQKLRVQVYPKIIKILDEEV